MATSESVRQEIIIKAEQYDDAKDEIIKKSKVTSKVR